MIEKQYTSIQKFFWWLSGSEIHVLKECKNDYNRHATTGAILLVTATVAFAAGSYAGWYFSYDYKTGQHSLKAALLFGLLWGSLIYTIDRMMVVSIKKDPYLPKEQQPYWSILSPRIIIGVMIAFFISIPIEILIFSENIDRQMEIDNIKDVADLVQNKHIINNTKGREQSIKGDSGRIQDIRDQLNQPCPIEEYQNLRRDYSTCTTLSSQLEQRYSAEKAKYERMISDNPPNPNEKGTKYFYPEDIEQKSRVRSALENYAAKRNECRSIYNRANTIATNYFNRLRQTEDSLRQIVGVNALKLGKDLDSIRDYGSNQSKILNNMKGFDTRFRALESAAWAKGGGAVLFLLWLIRFVFIGLEILPTYNKLSTPIGDYDRAINAREKIFANYLISEISLQQDLEFDRRRREKDEIDKNEQERLQQEAALNKRVLAKVAETQERVALDALKKWEEKETGNTQNVATQNGSVN